MTEVFDRFMKQATSQGREYGDGFNSSHFAGLTQSELANAIGILEERALDGDAIAINAISFIGKDEAETILEKVLSKSDCLSTKAINQASFEAYKITGQRRYLVNIFDNLDLFSDQDKWHSIRLLCSVDYGKDLFEGVKAVFERLVLDERDEVLRHSAAKKILLEKGILEGTSTYKEKIRRLINGEREVREKALSEL